MQLSAQEAWKRILEEAYRQVPEKVNRGYLEPTEAIALEEGRLVVAAADEFSAKWNETKYGGVLSTLAEPVLGRATSVVFRVKEDLRRRPQMDFFVGPQAEGGSPTSWRPQRPTPLPRPRGRPTIPFSFMGPPGWARRT
jgi:chromosomal replication initiation ATPase DnaA